MVKGKILHKQLKKMHIFFYSCVNEIYMGSEEIRNTIHSLMCLLINGMFSVLLPASTEQSKCLEVTINLQS